MVVIWRNQTGDIKLYADFSIGLNDSEKHYPLLTLDDIFTSLNGEIYFSKTDFA